MRGRGYPAVMRARRFSGPPLPQNPVDTDRSRAATSSTGPDAGATARCRHPGPATHKTFWYPNEEELMDPFGARTVRNGHTLRRLGIALDLLVAGLTSGLLTVGAAVLIGGSETVDSAPSATCVAAITSDD